MSSISESSDLNQKEAPWWTRGLCNWNENQRLPILWWERDFTL